MASPSTPSVEKPLLQKAARFIEAADYAKATQAIEEHLKSFPYDSQAWAQRSLVLILTGQDSLAFEAAGIALRIDPKNTDAWSMQGNALMQLGKFEEALASYQKVTDSSPQSSVAQYNKGNALRRLGRIDEAIQCIEISLTLDAHYTNALTVMGSLQQAKGNLESAESYFNRALSVNRSAADAHFNRGLLYLACEKFEPGWQDYEWRLQWDAVIRQGQSKSVDRLAPDWEGQHTQQPILVVPEQGLGDQIFYSGMLVDLQQAIPGSTVCTVPRLIDLFSRSFPSLHFVTPEQINSNQQLYKHQFSAQVHMGSLGKFFRSTDKDFQRIKCGYLSADTQKTAYLHQALKRQDKVLCGISWRSKNHEFGQAKSLTLSELAPVLKSANVDFVDLQYGDTQDEINQLHQQFGISLQQADGIDNFQDIDALAALINACDIVITVSNTTAHLAAALGKPVLVMLPNSPSLFWYWHLNRADSPWYPSAVLLRQSTPGEWGDVLATAKSALDEFVKAVLP